MVAMLTHCTTTTYQVAGYTQRYGSEIFPPTSDVEVYDRGRGPSRGIKVIGAIEIAGGPSTKKSDLLEAAVKRARELGADALIDVRTEFDEPNYVENHRKVTASPGKTALAVVGGVLLVGLVVASATDSAGNAGTANTASLDDNDDDRADPNDSRTRTPASDHRVAVLRAQAVRYVTHPESQPALDATELARVRHWLDEQLGTRHQALLWCVGILEPSATTADVVLALEVESTGQVLAAKTLESTIQHPRFGACIERSLKRAPFNPTPTGRRVSMRVPVRLQADGCVSLECI